MRAYILGTGRRVSPFDDRPGDLTFGFTTFAAATEGALARRAVDVSRVPVGAAPPDPGGPCLVLGDHVYASEKCLHDFLNLSAASDAVEQLALCRTPASDYARPVSSVGVEPLDEEGPGARPADGKGPEAAASERVVYDCFYVPAGKLPPRLGGAELLAALRAEARARVVKKNEIGVEVRLPLLGDPEHTRMIYPITSTVAGHVEHWVHVLWLNHQAFGVQWMERVRRRPLWALLRLLTCVPPTRDNIIRRFVARGKNVRIHPTASVEGSILGDNVVIGARASVRNSILGDGVEVGDHAAVIACTLGDRAYVTPKTFFVWSTAFPDAVSNNLKTQMSILGRGAGTSHWAGLIDAKFQGSIGVLHDGKVTSTERSFLGSCLGHGSYVGAKVLLQPGREVPNGTFVAMRPDELVSEIPEGIVPGVPMVRDAGTLVPLGDLRLRARTG